MKEDWNPDTSNKLISSSGGVPFYLQSKFLERDKMFY